MAVPQALTDALDKVNTATNKLAGVVRDLRDRVKTGMTQADVDAVQGRLDQVAASLDGIAADPNNPVPPTPVP